MDDRNIMDELNELEKKGLLSKKVVILKGPIQDGFPAVEKREESIIDDEGLKETEISELYYAPACNHIIHSEDEIGSVCSVCIQPMCQACSINNVCPTCGKAVCKQDQTQIEEIGLVCTHCKKEWLKKKLVSFILTLAAVVTIIYLVMRFIN